MDNFLTKIYHEERTKTAGADMDRYLSDLPLDVLLKIAVAGPDEPSKPTSVPAGALDAAASRIRKYVEDEHKGESTDSKSVSHNSYSGKSKVAGKGADPHTVTPKSWAEGTEGMSRASQLTDTGHGQFLMNEELAADRSRQGLKGALVGGGIGGIGGGFIGRATGSTPMGIAMGALLGANIGSGIKREKANTDFLKARGIKQTGFLGMGRGAYTPEAAEKYLKKSKEANLTKECSASAQEKAKIAMIALRSIQGAPSMVKSAAAALAGRKIAQE